MTTPRIRTRWFRGSAPRDARAIASAAAAIVWRTANHHVRHMRSVDFAIDTGTPYVALLAEMLCLLVAVADRIAYERDAGAWRETFTRALAIRVAELFDESFVELLGPLEGESYKARLIERINERSAEYAAYRYRQGEAEFAWLRHFGDAVARVLPEAFDRRWGADQAMSIEGPAAIETLAAALGRLFGGTGIAGTADERAPA